MSDAREAYIAGKNTPLGTPTPSVFKSDSETKSFQAAQDEKAYVEKAKGNPTNNPNVDNYTFQTESYQNVPSPEEVAEVTGKDPYETGADTSKGIYTIKPEKETTNWLTPSFALNLGIAGAKGIEVLLDKVFKPSVEDFNDPVVLASINRLFEEKKKELGEKKGEEFKTNYLKKYEDKMKEAFNPQLQQFEDEQGFGLTGETGIASLFDDKLKKAAADAKSGDLGKGVQRINFPEEFYLDDGKKGIMPQTTDGLENLAKLDASQYAGTDLAQMIFDARATLDQNKGNQGGGGAGIPSLPQVQYTDIPMEDKMDISRREPSLTLGYGPGDMPYTAVIPREGYRYTHDEAGRRYEIPIGYNPLGDAFGTTYGGEQFGWRPNPWDIQPVEQTPATGVASLAPTTIDYASMAPQYPSYVNQGVASPQLGNWYQNLNRYT